MFLAAQTKIAGDAGATSSLMGLPKDPGPNQKMRGCAGLFKIMGRNGVELPQLWAQGTPTSVLATGAFPSTQLLTSATGPGPRYQTPHNLILRYESLRLLRTRSSFKRFGNMARIGKRSHPPSSLTELRSLLRIIIWPCVLKRIVPPV